MIFMTILKVIFILLLCTPLIYITIYFLNKLLDEVIKLNQEDGHGEAHRPIRRNINRQGRRHQR